MDDVNVTRRTTDVQTTDPIDVLAGSIVRRNGS